MAFYLYLCKIYVIKLLFTYSFDVLYIGSQYDQDWENSLENYIYSCPVHKNKLVHVHLHVLYIFYFSFILKFYILKLVHREHP